MQGQSITFDAPALPGLDELLVSGGDERLTLDHRGRNKYHLDPRSPGGTFHRGSCTCSPINADARDAAATGLARLTSGQLSRAELLTDQRQRLLDIFVPGPHEGADVIFAPSGSDLCYLPLLFVALTQPGRKITNVVAASEELGSGSLLAHEGRYFAAQTQIADDLAIGETLAPELAVDAVFLPARDERGGIADHGEAIEQLIAHRDADDVLIVNLVIGSKSGIENGVRIIERFADDDIVWTVDLCQMRTRPALFEHLLELGCLLLCTGSKFYEAPPFCGAMLVPADWMERLSSVEATSVEGFASIFTAGDFPPALSAIGAAFPAVENTGLMLRWEAALHEMEAFDAIPASETAAAIAAWHDSVVERIEASDVLALLRDQDQTNDSIVSFRVRDRVGGHFNRDDLAEIHRRLAVDGVEEVAPFRRATIGQPVSYSSGSFLRVAIGSSAVRNAAAHGFDPSFDLALLAAIERVAGEL